jgi:hypothetical protein
MKLNLHIIKHELNELVIDAKLPLDNSLTLLGVGLASETWLNEKQDILYIVREDNPVFKSITQCAAQLLVLSDSAPGEVFSRINGSYLLMRTDISENELLNRVADVFFRYNRWEEDVEALIVSGASLNSILEMGYTYIGNPMALCDASLHCIASCKKQFAPTNNSVWKSIDTPGHSSVTLNALLRSNNLVDRVRSTREVFTYQLPGDTERVMHLNIFSKQKRIAYLVAVDTLQPFNEYICSIAIRFGQLLAIALNTNIVYQRENLSNIDLVSRRILAEEQINEVYLQFVLDQVGWKRNDAYCICEFETAKTQTAYDTLPDIVLFQNSMRDSSIFYYRTCIMVVYNLTKSRQSYSELGIQLEGLLEKSHYLGGISDVFYDYTNLKFYEKEASAALNYAKTNVQERNENLVFYRECMLDNMLRMCDKSFDLRLLCRSDIYQLWEYDKKHNTSYVDTLYVYLSSGENLIESAKRMFVHRNTFVYRIGKIIELIGEDAFRGDNSTLEIMLSCIVIKHLKNQIPSDT